MTVTVGSILEKSRAALENAGVDSPRLSTQLLVGHALNMDRVRLFMESERPLTLDEQGVIQTLVDRRATGEPVAYILGEREFYGLDFKVGPGVLVPRPETEHLIDKTGELFDSDQDFSYADLGCGSGIIGVTLATTFSRAKGVAVDLSDEALHYTKLNAEHHGVADRLRIMKGDFTTPLFDDESLDLIVSNPPYVTDGEYLEVSHEVSDFEPRTALTSGPDGLDHIRALVPLAVKALKPGGWLLMEIGWKQKSSLVDILSSHDQLTEIAVLKDLAGNDRVAVAQKL